MHIECRFSRDVAQEDALTCSRVSFSSLVSISICKTAYQLFCSFVVGWFEQTGLVPKSKSHLVGDLVLRFPPSDANLFKIIKIKICGFHCQKEKKTRKTHMKDKTVECKRFGS